MLWSVFRACFFLLNAKTNAKISSTVLGPTSADGSYPGGGGRRAPSVPPASLPLVVRNGANMMCGWELVYVCGEGLKGSGGRRDGIFRTYGRVFEVWDLVTFGFQGHKIHTLVPYE